MSPEFRILNLADGKRRYDNIQRVELGVEGSTMIVDLCKCTALIVYKVFAHQLSLLSLPSSLHSGIS